MRSRPPVAPRPPPDGAEPLPPRGGVPFDAGPLPVDWRGGAVGAGPRCSPATSHRICQRPPNSS
ncbi:hypothetical protein [Plantactinospora veratri]